MFVPWPNARQLNQGLSTESNSTAPTDVLTTSIGQLHISNPRQQNFQSFDFNIGASGFPFNPYSNLDIGTPRDRARLRQKALLPLRELTGTRSDAGEMAESVTDVDNPSKNISLAHHEDNDTSAIANLSAAFSSVEDDERVSMSELNSSLPDLAGDNSYQLPSNTAGAVDTEDETRNRSLFISGVGLTPHLVRALDSIHSHYSSLEGSGAFAGTESAFAPTGVAALSAHDLPSPISTFPGMSQPSPTSMDARTSPTASMSLGSRAFSDIDVIHAEMGADASLLMYGNGLRNSGLDLASVRDGPLSRISGSSLTTLAVQLSPGADNNDNMRTPVTDRNTSLTSHMSRTMTGNASVNVAADASGKNDDAVTPHDQHSSIMDLYGDQSLLDGFDGLYGDEDDYDDDEDDEDLEMALQEESVQAYDDYGYYDEIGKYPLLVATAEGDVHEAIRILYNTAKDADKAEKKSKTHQTEPTSTETLSREEMLEYLDNMKPAQRAAVKALVNTCDKQHVTATALACRFGRVHIFDMLLKFNADVNKEDVNNVAPLALAAGQGVAVIVASLLKAKANVHMQDIDGLTPLCYAVRQSREKAAELLIEAKATIERVDEKLYSYLHIACGKGAAEMVDILIRHGAAVDAVDERMRTPLYLACEYGQDKAALKCLEHKAEVRVVDEQGVSILHWAVAGCSENVVAKVLAMKADINTTTESGDSPLHWAVEGNRMDVIPLLLRMKADPNAVDSEGDSVLDLARSRCGGEITEVVKKFGGTRTNKH